MEFVFVIPRGELFPDCYPQGLHLFGPESPREEVEGRIRRHGFFVEREHAESNPNLKQVIPYSICLVGGEILLMRRLPQGGEKRLHDKLSIGVGGHINPEDLELPHLAGNGEGSPEGRPDPVLAGTRREVAEELVVDGTYEIHPVGLLNDDSNPVGAVHVGMVQILTIQGSVSIREQDVLEGRLTRPDELRSLLAEGANFETWSSILVESLDELLSELPVSV